MLRKKVIQAVGTLDLRSYSAAAVGMIKKIRSVGMVILPKDASEEFMEAYGQIDFQAVGSVLTLDKEDMICELNGFSVLTGDTVKENTIYVVNGFAVVHSLTSDLVPRFVVNGFVLKEKNSSAEFLSVNGKIMEAEDLSKAKIMPDILKLDTSVLNNLETGSVLVISNNLIVDDYVSEELLKEKNIHFIVGNKILCNKSVYGYIAAHSDVGNKIEM